MDAREIKDLLKYVKNAGFHEVELEMEGLRLRVVKDNPADGVLATTAVTHTALPTVSEPAVATHPAPAMLPSATAQPASGAGAPPLREAAQAPDLYEQKSPMVGTFYRASSPNSDPFVSVGDRVEVGQTLCILEAMKLMNEIEAEVAGTVVEVTVENAQPVEYGEVLFRIRSNA